MSTNSPIAQDKPRRLPSDAELMALPRDGYKRELLNGEIITSPAGFDHGRRIMRFSTVFAAFVYQHNLGEVFDGQTGFRMSNGDVLNPDISFVSRARMLQTGQRDAGGLYQPTTASSAPPCLKRPMSCPGKMLSTAFGSPLPQCLPGWSTAPEAA
jgi:Uma2 family endonuclease